MSRFTNLFVVLVALATLLEFATGESRFLYSNTRICSNTKHSFCLSYDKHRDLVVLDKKQRLRFEIESVDGINMELNRVYTFAVDKATRKKVKTCLVKKEISKTNLHGLTLAPCDSDENELVLAVSPDGSDRDEFLLREIGFLDREAEVKDALCMTMTHRQDDTFEPVTEDDVITRKTPVILESCEAEKSVAQDFQARHYNTKVSERIVPEEPLKKQIGRFCLVDKPDLCLGISLTNATILENNKFLQVKNLTKNTNKGLADLKMEWYWDQTTGKIASAANMDYCIEAIYNAPTGRNRPGIPQFDDILYLGACDPNRQVELGDTAFRGLPASESFYTKTVYGGKGNEGFMEIRTDVPLAARPTGSDISVNSAKCLSVVRCVRHDFDSCTKYNSHKVYDPEELEQGAYVRLKDCDSDSLSSQRFFYTVEQDITFPPTKSPTPPVVTAPPTDPPVEDTPAPTPKLTTQAPSPAPVATGQIIPPTAGEQPGNEDITTTAGGLTIGLAIVGVLCLAIIVAGVIYYFKHKGEFQELPEEDENFIARV